MSAPSLRACLACCVVVIALLAAAPAARAFEDGKLLNPAICQPYAPDTTAAELAYSPTGVYNPGTTSEKVLCVLPSDQETAYAANGMGVSLWYRVVGPTPSRMTCSLYIGSLSQDDAPVSTSTASGTLESGGSRGYLSVTGTAHATPWAPVTLICSIPPKTSFAAMRFVELEATHLTD